MSWRRLGTNRRAWKRAMRKEHEAQKEKIRDARLAGTGRHQYLERRATAGTYVGACTCGWEAATDTTARTFAEQDWEQHHKAVYALEQLRQAERKQKETEEQERKKAELELIALRIEFQKIKDRYQK